MRHRMGLVASLDGTRIVRAELTTDASEAQAAGERLADLNDDIPNHLHRDAPGMFLDEFVECPAIHQLHHHQEPAVPVEFLNSVISPVGYEHVAVMVNLYAPWMVELAITGA
jgi:hypothetical protein